MEGQPHGGVAVACIGARIPAGVNHLKSIGICRLNSSHHFIRSTITVKHYEEKQCFKSRSVDIIILLFMY
jgi:hypothetical protein